MKQPRKITIPDEELIRLYQEEKKSYKEIGLSLGCSGVAVWKKLRKLLPNPADQILEESGLSEPMRRFCIARATGATRTQAVLAGYETTAPNSIKSIACDLLKDERVIDCINRLMAVHGLTRNHRISRLKQHVDNRDPDVSLKALDMSFKLDDSYPNKHVDLNVNIDTMDEAQIEARLKNLIAKMNPEEVAELLDRTMIDVTPGKEG